MSSLHQEVREIVRQELAHALMATVKDTDTAYRATATRFPSDPGVNRLRMIQQFGLASRAPDGMESVTMPVGGDPTHLILLGQNDTDRPGLSKGEAALYGSDGQLVFLKLGGSVLLGSKSAAEPAVLGNVLKSFLGAVLDQFLNAPQIGIDSFSLPVFLDPGIRAGLTLLKTQYLTNTSTNIVAKKIFVERGT